MFGLGAHELLIVGIVAVILFGRKLPDVARSLGSSYREFRKGLNEFQSSVNVDSYTSTSSPYSGSSSTPRLHDEYADTATAPKFEPPPAEPQSAAGETGAEETSAGEAGAGEAVGSTESSSNSEEKSAASNS
jgi:sec-independent protein translocase protein TatA